MLYEKYFMKHYYLFFKENNFSFMSQKRQAPTTPDDAAFTRFRATDYRISPLIPAVRLTIRKNSNRSPTLKLDYRTLKSTNVA